MRGATLLQTRTSRRSLVPVGPRLLVGGPSGILDFVLRTLWPPPPPPPVSHCCRRYPRHPTPCCWCQGWSGTQVLVTSSSQKYRNTVTSSGEIFEKYSKQRTDARFFVTRTSTRRGGIAYCRKVELVKQLLLFQS